MIKDGQGSSITLNAKDGSITISARKDLTITASGTLKLQAAGGDTAITMDEIAGRRQLTTEEARWTPSSTDAG